mgnify:CR=1 FL=1
MDDLQSIDDACRGPNKDASGAEVAEPTNAGEYTAVIAYKGNYTGWLEQKQKRAEVEGKQEEARERTLARELDWIRASPKARQAMRESTASKTSMIHREEERERTDRISIRDYSSGGASRDSGGGSASQRDAERRHLHDRPGRQWWRGRRAAETDGQRFGLQHIRQHQNRRPVRLRAEFLGPQCGLRPHCRRDSKACTVDAGFPGWYHRPCTQVLK